MSRIRTAAEIGAVTVVSLGFLAWCAFRAPAGPSGQEQHMRRGEPRPEPVPAAQIEPTGWRAR